MYTVFPQYYRGHREREENRNRLICSQIITHTHTHTGYTIAITRRYVFGLNDLKVYFVGLG
jgi:hypothetical protein